MTVDGCSDEIAKENQISDVDCLHGFRKDHVMIERMIISNII